MTPVVGKKLDEIFAHLKTATVALREREAEIFDDVEPILRLHTPLATGSDQIAAQSARANDFQVRALLPFKVEEYSQDFQGTELEQFQEFLNDADNVMTLPGDRSANDAYVLVGKGVIAASDVIIAIWDGEPGNGPGGTAHVVELALREGVPIIHLYIDRAKEDASSVRLIMGGDFDEPELGKLDSPDDYVRMLTEILAPHEQVERKHIIDYYAEVENHKNFRFEYSIMLAMLRIKPLPARPWLQESIDSEIERERSVVRDNYPPTLRMPLERGYGWANFLAIRYAQRFRSGHITNYALSAIAVLVALTGLIVPSIKLYLVMSELLLIGLLFYNTGAGKKGDWHRRWLQYRHLAESLRPLIYLKRIGLSGPPFRSDFILGAHRKEAGTDWTRWYTAAIWREMSSPGGEMSREQVIELAKVAIEEQVLPQAEYHEVNAHRMRELDHRLHEVGNFLMGSVIATCVLFIVGYFTVPDMLYSLTPWIVFLTAGLPAAGAAVFGMRGHGEHLLQANRSAESSAALRQNAKRLAAIENIEELAAELQVTSHIMLADLNEWTTTYSERSLEVPA
ncbi:hypothetical protein [Altererythrobacter sp. MF3-039]|uniref:hypothetical protein n=1 Tax=Altererythrobacter sp. MF3-039 TaxID=3252901 RepID=UPI00390CBCC4